MISTLRSEGLMVFGVLGKAAAAGAAGGVAADAGGVGGVGGTCVLAGVVGVVELGVSLMAVVFMFWQIPWSMLAAGFGGRQSCKLSMHGRA